MDCRRYGGSMIELARRRMMMGGSALPYDAEVEYIKMTSVYGTYTKFSPIQGYVDLRISIQNIGAKNNYAEVIRIGSWNAAAPRICRYDIYRNVNTTSVVEDNTSALQTVGTADGSIITRTNIRYDSSQAPSSSYGSFMIQGKPADLLTLYYLRLRDWFGNTIHNYIPVRVGNVGRLYDRVQGVILPSTNMTIIPGPDKTV